MKELKVGNNEAGQRLDKLLGKYLNKASYGFLAKMLRKKNIVLNDRKATGKEILQIGDSVKIYFSDETIEKFTDHGICSGENAKSDKKESKASLAPEIIYEDTHVLFINKDINTLCQKADPHDYTLSEWIVDHMLETGELSESDLESFRPAICNRLDRNTTGIVCGGKSLAGIQALSRMFHDRTVHKYYHALVCGSVQEDALLEGYLKKDEKTNRVVLHRDPVEGASYIKTGFHVIKSSEQAALLEIQLFTGKTHQIRSHLASIGHPIVGDRKYDCNGQAKRLGEKCHVRYQLLHAVRLEIEDAEEVLDYLNGRSITAAKPDYFIKAEDMLLK